MHIFLSVLTLLAFVPNEPFSNEKSYSRELCQSTILELMNAQDDSILQINESGEVYLKSTCLIPTEQGLFMKTRSGECLRIPMLLSNQHGCYTTVQTDATVYPVIRCKNCDLPFNPNIFNRGKCPRCGTQN